MERFARRKLNSTVSCGETGDDGMDGVVSEVTGELIEDMDSLTSEGRNYGLGEPLSTWLSNRSAASVHIKQLKFKIPAPIKLFSFYF